MNFESVLFDFDYTLGDSTIGIFESANFALVQMGYAPAELESVRKSVGLTLEQTFTYLTTIEDNVLSQNFARLFKEKADVIMTASTALLPDALDTLKWLKAKAIKTGIVTTKRHYRIDEILAKFTAASLIDIIVGSEDVTNKKPDPEGLLYALERMAVKKENALYVGDSIVDAKTAENAGVSFVAVTTGATVKEAFYRYPHIKIIDNLSQLLSL